MGRLCTLSEPLSLSDTVERIKGHLGLPHVRLALGAGRTLGKWAVSQTTCQDWHCRNTASSSGGMTVGNTAVFTGFTSKN